MFANSPRLISSACLFLLQMIFLGTFVADLLVFSDLLLHSSIVQIRNYLKTYFNK